MNRPTIALACILKNELKNLDRFMASVEGCFDEIHFTDTGSTDGSIEHITQWHHKGQSPAGNTPIFLHHFKWIDDFSAARNASFAPVKTDYVMWMDLDDVLSSKEDFCHFRDHVMAIADYWIATYHYAVDQNGLPVCSFARERVMKTSLGFQWRYFIHEGVVPQSPHKAHLDLQYATNWSVIHKRDDEDSRRDRSRNISIMEKRKSEFDARMQYYYGKELFENGKPFEGLTELMKAVCLPELEGHDRIMGIQYAAMSAMQLNQFEKAIQLAHQGLQLSPERAEFFIIIADSYQKLGKLIEAAPYYRAASFCRYQGSGLMQQAVVSHEPSYKHYPLNQIAKIRAHQGDIEGAEKILSEALGHGPDLETMGMSSELKTLKERMGIAIQVEKKKTRDIVITCVPSFYEWDEKVYQERGIGGSETAVVEMARWLEKKTNRTVRVFNQQNGYAEINGVIYDKMSEAPRHLSTHEPALHVMWRHNDKMTDSRTVLWCHDLMVPGIEHHHIYDKLLCLSSFHKNFVHGLWRVPLDKILVTENGINPERWWKSEWPAKDYGKVVWSSSPDRGLEHAIRVMDLVHAQIPESSLHVYYGVDNLRQNGKAAEADKLMAMMSERSWVKYHGNLEQRKLTEELKTACVWLYPTNFLETYCITALEMLASNVYPVVRRWGGLADTLEPFAMRGAASIIGTEPTDYSAYALEVFEALATRKWEKMGSFPFTEHSWEKVADRWIEEFKLLE